MFFDATVPIGGGEVWVDVNFPLGGGVGDRVDVYFPLSGRSGRAFVAFYCFVGSRGGAYVGVDCPVGRGGGDFYGRRPLSLERTFLFKRLCQGFLSKVL